jgi:hypothetical protein
MKIQHTLFCPIWKPGNTGVKHDAAGSVAEPGSTRSRLPDQLAIRRLLAIGGLCLICVPCAFSTTFVWSAASNQILVGNGGPATLSQIKAALPNAPLDLVDANNKIWLLRANLVIQGGSILVLHGAAAGGDVNELRMQSVASVSPCDCVVSLTADWGSLDINSTKIDSWDTMSGGPNINSLSGGGRAYIAVVSSLSTNGVTPLNSRMDITNSEICFLGGTNLNDYGLMWKVSGIDPNPANNTHGVQVYGNVVNSRLHDNYIGGYTLGAANMLWLTNRIYNNALYGLDLENYSDGLLIWGNSFTNNGGGSLQVVDSDYNTVAGNNFTDPTGLLQFHGSVSNWLDGNSIPTTMAILTTGDTSLSASTYVRNQAYLNVELGANATTIFMDAQGRIYQPDEGTIQSVISTSGSTLTLTPASIGTSTTVIARSLWAAVGSGNDYITQLVWTNGTSRLWSANAGFVGQSLLFVVGGLNANSAYAVSKNGSVFTNVQSDVTGLIHIADTASVTDTVIYYLNLQSANLSPILPYQANVVVNVGATLVVTNTATDSTVPANLLTYALQTAPTNASISAAGIITWTPTQAQGPSINVFTTVASDNSVPPLSATNLFIVSVNPPVPVFVQVNSTLNNGIVISWPASSSGWVLQQSLTLGATNWVDVNPGLILSAGNQSQMTITNPAATSFFRLKFEQQ